MRNGAGKGTPTDSSVPLLVGAPSFSELGTSTITLFVQLKNLHFSLLWFSDSAGSLGGAKDAAGGAGLLPPTVSPLFLVGGGGSTGATTAFTFLSTTITVYAAPIFIGLSFSKEWRETGRKNDKF
jgi:hypothetical protein